MFGHSFLVDCWPFLLGVGVGLSFFGWELVLPLRCGGCPFLLGGCPFVLHGGVWPFLLGVWVLALARLSLVVVCPSFLLGLSALLVGWPFGMKVGRAFSGWELVSFSRWESAFPSHGWGIGLSFSRWRVGPSFSGCGLALPSCGLALPSWDPVFGPSFSCWGLEESPKSVPKKHPKNPENNAMKSLEKASK